MAKEKVYRAYITDALRIIGENTAPLAHGKYLERRWIDLIEPQEQEERTADEIIEHVTQKLKEV